MANLNKVMLIGRLTQDPETRTFANGGKVTKIRFAVNNRKKNQQTGQWEDVPVYLDADAFNRGEFGKLADRLETVRKGQQIFIEGHLRMDEWERDGQKRTKLLVVIDNLQYLEPRAEGGGYGGSRMGGAPQSEPTYSSGGGYDDGGFGGGGYDDYNESGAEGGSEEDKIPF